MNKVSIIGTGRLGTSLATALSQKGFKIKALADRSLALAQESRKIIGEGIALAETHQAARQGEIIFLCVPDEEIEKATEKLKNSEIEWQGKIVFHCSGLLGSEALKPLQAKGASVASFHPVQSFSQKKTPPSRFKNIYIGLEGDKKALVAAKKIVRALGSRHFIIQAKDKPLYHAACSTASNFLVVLLDMACFLLKQIGLQEKKASAILLPLSEGTLHNVKHLYTAASLTGPIRRGDALSVEKHLSALKRYPLFYETYLKLGARALQIARRNGLSPRKIKSLKRLLEEK